jgi:hypothetical protein
MKPFVELRFLDLRTGTPTVFTADEEVGESPGADMRFIAQVRRDGWWVIEEPNRRQVYFAPAAFLGATSYQATT